MEVKIPYNPGLHLGQWVNMKTLTPVTTLDKNVSPTEVKQVREFTTKFSFIENLEDICHVLSVPPEYVLKVKAKIIPDKVVEACLQNLGQTNSFTLVFKAKYTERTEETSASESSKATDQTPEPSFAETSVDKEQATHLVKSITLGQDLFVVMTVRDKIEGKSSKLRKKLTKKCLGSTFGCLDGNTLENVNKKAAKFDKYFSENFVDCFYFSFTQLDKYPTEWSGVVSILTKFCDQFTVWSKQIKETPLRLVWVDEAKSCGRIAVHAFSTTEEDTASINVFKVIHQNVIKPASNYLSSLGKSNSSAATFQTKTKLDNEERQDCVVLGTTAIEVYILEITLQPLETDQSLLKTIKAQNHTTDERILEQLFNCEKAENMIKEFKAKLEHDEINITKIQKQDIERIETFNKEVTEKIINLTAEMDFTSTLSENSVETACSINTLEQVKKLIENLTLTLPPGGEISLLLIGKTGHGKSSTGNSILLREFFKYSSDTDSETFECTTGHAKIDGRDLRIVDTPGVCDTRLSTKEYVEHAKLVFSRIIAASPKGFHALLFVFKFPGRYTSEEEKCITLLKRMLGESIIKNHGVCVFTGGDYFISQMAKEKKNWSFKHWCQNQKGNMGKLFTECQYRCLLFDNLTNDQTVKKQQLVQLVALVDSELNSTAYTNELFDLANKEREKFYAEMRLESEDVFRDIQLLQANIDKVLSRDSTSPEEKQTFLATIDQLSNKLREIAIKAEDAQLINLLNTASKVKEDFKRQQKEIALKTKMSEDISRINNSLGGADEEKITALETELSKLKENIINIEDDYIGSYIATVEKNIICERNRAAEKKTEEEIRKKEMNEKEECDNLKQRIYRILEFAIDIAEENYPELENQLVKLKHDVDRINDEHLCEVFNTAEKSLNKTKIKHQEDRKNKEILDERFSEIERKEAMMTENISTPVKEKIDEGTSCFPASSMVTLISGNSVTLGDLKVGDKVLVVDEDNQLTFDIVYMFGHRDSNVLREFVALRTSSLKVLVTSGHYVFVMRDDKKVSLAARDVQVGDCLLVVTSDGLQPEQVEAITLEQESGLFAPFTNSGTILVNGALMSCYVDVLAHNTCHTCLWPVRQLFKMSPRALTFINGSPAKHTIPPWARTFIKIRHATKPLL